MHRSSDPLMPFTSRFPLSPAQGRIEPSTAGPSGVESRPFGMRYAVRPVEAGKHSMRPTQKSRTKQTAITKDGVTDSAAVGPHAGYAVRGPVKITVSEE